MTAIACSELIADVERIARSGPPERRARMLRELTDLFRSAAGRLQPDQIGVFDRGLAKLIERSDTRTLAGLSATLAELDPAPADTIRRLALPLGFVDVKVCAVDDTWSGLKFVVRLRDRRSAC